MRKSEKVHIFSLKGEDFIVSKKTIDRAIEHLHAYHQSTRTSPGRKGSCSRGRTLKSLRRKHRELRARQLPDVGHGLRVAMLRQNWNEVAHITRFLTSAGISLYASLIIRTCFYLLFHHPASTPELLENFVRKLTGYVSTEEIRKFIKILFAIREETLPVCEAGKYIRKGVMYKVIDDVYFKDL